MKGEETAQMVKYKKYFIVSKREVGNPQISSAETVHANFGFYRPEPVVHT
jgi:hypothetical protein